MTELQAPPRVDGFKGLNNRIDPTRLGLEWQIQADNVLCDDASYLVRRPGLQTLSSGLIDLYGRRDGRLLGVTSGNVLVEILEDGTQSTLFYGMEGGPFQWTELGYVVFAMSSTHAWAVYPNRIIEWGSLCPPAVATNVLSDPISYPPPMGNILGVRRSQLAIAVWEDEKDRSVLYFSRSDYPHEFRLERDYQIFAGRINLLMSVSTAFIVATDRAIYLDPYDTPLVRVADYGVQFGGGIYDTRDTVFFWTELGLCKVAPFENLVDKQLAIIERNSVTSALLDWHGSRYAIVNQTGSVTTRRGARPYEPMAIATVNDQGIS